MPETPFAWAGDVRAFLDTPEEELLRELTRFARETGAPQLFAWDRSLGILRRELAQCGAHAERFGLVLEFELHRGGGRRPDLIVLENGIVLVVEFKNRVDPEPADLDQVRTYVQFLVDYHSACRGKRLVPVLVPIGMTGDAFELDGVQVVPPSGLRGLIRGLAAGGRPNARGWAGAPCTPLPGLVEAARLLFERQPLPRIKRAESARIPETVSLIESALREHTLVLVTGVPGSGKTLVGLQVAHSRAFPAVFLSGNGPLVQVLRYSLASREFVRDIHSFLRERDAPPPGLAVVFDEAQRAWDRDRVIEKHQGRFAASEPELLLRRVGRVVALLGEGQEIHAGEESGIGQWADGARDWDVVGPPHLAQHFRRYRSEELLNLTSSLRSHRASDLALWADLLLGGKLDEARRVVLEGYTMLASRNLDVLRDYARGREVRCGILASSKHRKLEVRVARHPYWHYGEWYEAPASDPRSSCRLELAVSEFGCQGLELELPILCWGPDLVWDGSRWVAKTGRPRKVRDPQRLRVNAYRVLLTRGRDGILVHVPPGLDSTWDALLAAGIRAVV